ncbi:hypothetical protein DND132_1439 [Pseudodesulfovibrio mercurii]|uniref:AAA+ ATPase domain-containing protein n=1 Tax=Pseudodesulfovibrio mercurii TaxID=641491 RepID=F0JE38_9BACT|nr:ATP-binding protein [Pseudodesulfovibrio mercurii]EGB14647.1 hypothetical protein DND132_1439 [Pseudodesulfovibrio mercurii]
MSTEKRTYWFVGAAWSKGDQADRFLSEGIWENGYDDKYTDHVKAMKPGERIAIKASYTRKRDLPFDNRGRPVSVMSIKAVGTITANDGNGKTVQVDWTPVDPIREWYFYTYQGTIWKVVEGSSWMADALIAFTFDGKGQNCAQFRNEPYWKDRYGSDEELDADEAPPVLDLWPANKQFKGIAATNGYVDGYREAIGMTIGGIDKEEFAEVLRNGDFFSQYTPQSCRSIFSILKRLGLIEHRGGGLWHPSELGEQFLESELPDLLVKRMVESVFGFAHILRLLEQQPVMAKKALHEDLRKIYPQWTTDFAPSSLGAWAKGLGLINEEDKEYSLTDYGRYWASALPESIPTPSLPVQQPPRHVEEEEEEAVSWPSLQDIAERFATDPELKKYVFSENQLNSLHLAWHCLDKKRFVILSGLSGTGKTALLRHYARMYCDLAGVDPEEHMAVVAVSPDWRDPSGLLGYLNALHADPTFQAEPGLRVVLGAAQHPDQPYFLILDEMNMARVERYFAPFLSAMEIDGALSLHANEDYVNDVPPSIPWPRNLFVGGTVNMDETTHPFSDKVLDRAFTFEFWDVELEGFFDRQPPERRMPEVEKLLIALQGELKAIRRHFGYRVADEMLAFVGSCANNGLTDQSVATELLDQAVFSKILPRLRGEESPSLLNALGNVRHICQENGLTKSAAKIESMTEQLSATGVTRFWA